MPDPGALAKLLANVGQSDRYERNATAAARGMFAATAAFTGNQKSALGQGQKSTLLLRRSKL